MEGKRYTGIDLLRNLSMLFVIIVHAVSSRGNLINQQTTSLNKSILSIIICLTIVAVNCFVLISGFLGYGRKFNFKNIINLWLQILFYSVLFTLITFAIEGSFSIKVFLKSFLPITTKEYRFFTCYFLLFFFMPLINIVVDKLNKKISYIFIVLFFLLFCVQDYISSYISSSVNDGIYSLSSGYSPIWFIFLYFVGATIKKHGLNIKINKYIYLLLYIMFSLGNVFLAFLMRKIFNMSFYYIGSYNSFIITLAAFCLFVFFLNINVKERKIYKVLSSSCFAVYITTENSFFIKNVMAKLSNYIKGNVALIIIEILAFAILTYAICILIDILRQKLFKLIKLNSLSEKISSKLPLNFDNEE